MDIQERIAQFRNMAEADPDNEMAHFSLGNALMQGGQHTEATASFERVIEINPDMSKAYQLAGQLLVDAGEQDRAVDLLLRGYEIAATRGDVLPKNAIADLLASLSVALPEVDESSVPVTPEGSFTCQQTGRAGSQLEKPPFRGPLGQRIQETISKETWDEWLGQGTKVINELRLDLSREDHSRIYDQHMLEFLGLEAWAHEHAPDML